MSEGHWEAAAETAASQTTTSVFPFRHSLLLPGTVFLLGLLSISVLMWSRYSGEQTALQAMYCDDALRRLEIAVITAHLWLEEHLTGDTSVEVDKIWEDLDHASELVLAILHGGRVHPGGPTLEPLEDPALRQQAEELDAHLVLLRSNSRERYRRGDGAGVGSAMDQSFDARFHLVLQNAESLRSRLAATMAEHRASDRRTLRWIMLSWVLLVSTAAAGLWNRESRRRQAEKNLRQREEELRRAQKLEAVGRLAGGIAHDINNYLGAVRAHCEVASLKNESGPELERRMEAAIATTTKASNLIKQLLTFSRRQPITPKVIDLNQVVTRLGGLMRRHLGDDVRLDISGQQDLWNVEIDPGQMEQILVNLLVNSRDAMPSGGSIEVTTSNLQQQPADSGLPRSGPWVRLVVADTGSGIPPQIRGKIFEPFFSTKTDRGSSGLGLATVYGIVQQNGGTIRVDSEPLHGTRFEILFPATARPPEARVEEDHQPAKISPSRILLVEDHPEMRDSIGDMLTALGHQTRVAADGELARKILTQDLGFELLVVDVVMPDISGPELVAWVRNQGSRIPCLLISGYSDDLVLQQCLQMENVSFLQKPFGAGTLSRHIAELRPPHFE